MHVVFSWEDVTNNAATCLKAKNFPSYDLIGVYFFDQW